MAKMNFLKNLGHGAANLGYNTAAAGYNASRAIGTSAKNMAVTAWAKFLPAGGAISGFTGGVVSQKVGATLVAVTLGTAGVGGAGMIANNMLVAQNTVLDDGVFNCEDLVDDTMNKNSMDGSNVDEDKEMEKHAEFIFSVFKSWGMSNENIAGVLGNWSVESGLDPSSIETIFDERFFIGPKKQAAIDADLKIEAIDADYARRYPAIDVAGAGYGAWTNGRMTELMDFAEEKGRDWYDPELQLAYSVSKDSSAELMRKFIANEVPGTDTVEGATMAFLTKWEGINDGSGGKRTEWAKKWYAKMGNWKANDALADSILKLADTSMSKANKKANQEAMKDCLPTAKTGGNEDAAKAALTFAWSNEDKGRGNDGTDIYRFLHDEVLENDPWYASCDRTVATAVRWSGSDDEFHPGGTEAQLQYLLTSDKWESIPPDSTHKSYEPGDIMIKIGHVLMFVGEDNVKEVWGSKAPAGADVVSGSCNDRSPGTGLDNSAYTHTFRLKKPESNSKFKDIKIPAGMKPDYASDLSRTTPQCPGSGG